MGSIFKLQQILAIEKTVLYDEARKKFSLSLMVTRFMIVGVEIVEGAAKLSPKMTGNH